MLVMEATRVACLRGARDCHEQARPRHIAMLGIGFTLPG